MFTIGDRKFARMRSEPLQCCASNTHTAPNEDVNLTSAASKRAKEQQSPESEAKNVSLKT